MNKYSDRELLDPTFPDPRRTDAEQAIARWREERAAQILDQGIEQLLEKQHQDMQTNEALERRAASWLVRFLTGGR